jgi:hypothetical protein
VVLSCNLGNAPFFFSNTARAVAVFARTSSRDYFDLIYTLCSQARDRLCDLVVRVPGYITQMYCVSCELRTEFIYVM